MSSPDSLVRATGRLLVLLALVAVPAAIYVFVVVRGQVASATAHNLRAVSEIGAQLDDRLDALRQVAFSLAVAPKEPPPTRLNACADAYCVIPGDAGADMSEQLKTNEWLSNADTDASREELRCDSVRDGRPAPDDVVITLGDGRDPWIVATACNRGAGEKIAGLRIRLHDLMPRRGVDSAFDGVIVADCSGQVLYSDSRRELAVSDIAELVVPGAVARTASGSGQKPESAASCVGRSQSWVVEPREVAGIPVRAFGHPFWSPNLTALAKPATAASPPAPKAPEAGDAREIVTWYLIGVQSEASFRQRTWTLPFEVLVVIAPLIVIALLAWPFLVIVLSAAGTRFGVAVPAAFAGSMLIGAGLLAVIVVALMHHYDTADRRDALLKNVAAKMTTAFAAELQRSVGMLGSQHEPTLNPLLKPGENIVEAITNCDGGADESRARCFAYYGPTAGGALLEAAADFETAFQLNNVGGRVGADLSIRDAGSSRRTLRDRGYLLRASRGLLSELPGEKPTRFAIEQIRSKEFGWALSSIVVPALESNVLSPANAGELAELMGAPRTLVLIKRFQTFFAPVLPLGVGFAVVRDEEGSASLDGTAWRIGDVVFHSEDSRSLIENVLSETDGNRALALALAERRATLLNVSYRGQPYRFYTKPLQFVPWTLIVTHDKKILRTLTQRTLLGAGTAYFSYLLLLAGVVWGIERRFRGRYVPDWLWPTRANRPLHRAMGAPVLGIAVLLFFAGSYWVTRETPPGALWAVVLGTLLATYGALAAHFAHVQAQPGVVADATSKRRGLLYVGYLVQRSRLGTALLLLGVAAILAPTLLEGSTDPRPMLLVAGLVVLFALPRATERQTVSDRPYIAFLIAVLAVVAVTPGALLAFDTFSFHREAYEKANLAHVGRSLLGRESALESEARRLQPTTFDRSGIPPIAIPETLLMRSVYVTGTEPITGESASVLARAASESVAAESRYRTATSWFATRIRVDGPAALIFADGWRLRTDGDSTVWSVGEIGTNRELFVSVAGSRGRHHELRAVDGGLFPFPKNRQQDGADNGRAALEGSTTASRGMLTVCALLAILGVGSLAWRALSKVAVSFFGRRDLRDGEFQRPRGTGHTWLECSVEDKLLLRHLAEGALLSSARNALAVERLARLGLVEYGPHLRISSAAVADEIRMTERSTEERELEKSGVVGPWAGIRGPFFTLLAFAVIAVVVAAPSALSSTMTLLGGSAAGVGVIAQIMNMLRKK